MRCPQCHKPVTWKGNLDRPFCSERCRMIDLGNWADENYRIASDEHVLSNDDEYDNTL